MAVKRIVTSRYCDEPMARAKGIIGNKTSSLPRCDKHCKDCLACIEVEAGGDREHVKKDRWEKNL